MPTAELIIVRHGQTRWNLDGRIQGHLDSELTPLGLRQAEAVAARLAEERLDAVYSSDLRRSLRTAEVICRSAGLPVVPDPRLRERSMGLFEGLTFEEIRRRYPEDYARFAARGPEYAIPGGESMRQCHERVIVGLQAVADRHPGRRAVVVTHGGPLSAAFRHTMGLPVNAPRCWSLFNASINRFEVQEDRWQLVVWGDLRHLDGIQRLDDA